MKYMPDNSHGNTYIDFLSGDYMSVYVNNYLKQLQGNIALSEYVAAQGDVDYFKVLFKSYNRIT